MNVVQARISSTKKHLANEADRFQAMSHSSALNLERAHLATTYGAYATGLRAGVGLVDQLLMSFGDTRIQLLGWVKNGVFVEHHKPLESYYDPAEDWERVYSIQP